MKPTEQHTAQKIEMFLINLFIDHDTQQRLTKWFFKYAGINKDKCPSARQILRVNGVLISSMVFFALTWIVFYLLTFTLFLSIVCGVNFMIVNV